MKNFATLLFVVISTGVLVIAVSFAAAAKYTNNNRQSRGHGASPRHRDYLHRNNHNDDNNNDAIATKYILMNECEGNNCERCISRKIPENFCHHVGHDGHITQSAECAPAPRAKCFQETVYQHSWSGNSGSGAGGQCDPHKIESTQPRQCGVCLQNRVHNHPHPNHGGDHPDGKHDFVIFSDCEGAGEGTMTLATGCDYTCQNCTGEKKKIHFKQCIADDEFAVSIEYTTPESCPEVLLVSDYRNKTDSNCTGEPGFVSHTFTNACYTEGQGYSLKYQCVDQNSK